MAFFTYKAINTTGQVVTGMVEGPTDKSAAKLLREKDLMVVSLVSADKLWTIEGLTNRMSRPGFGDVVNFTRQLSTMITAGLTLPDALNILHAQTTNPHFARIILDIEHKVVGGGNLADALEAQKGLFPQLYTALVRAGESSGTLDRVLARLADTMEAERELRAKVIGAMIYPIIIIIAMVIVIAVMMLVVIPKLSDLYTDFGMELPITTRTLIALSNFSVTYWWAVLLFIFGSVVLYSRWSKTEVGRRLIDSMIFRIPLFGELIKKLILVEFTRTLAMLIAAGIHILEGLRILKNTLTNQMFREALDEISSEVEKGYPIGESFAQHEVFPPIVSQMMKVGEETGKIDETLTKLSSYFDTETDHLIKGLTTAIEPIIMVVLGVGVGFIMFSIIVPLYNLTSQIK